MRALKLVAEALGFKDPDEMYVHIGTGKEKAQHVTNRLLKILVDKGNEEAEKPTVGTSASSTGIMAPMLTSVKRPKKHETHSSQGIVVKGVDDVLVRLSRCCNPVPGDDILGFVTRGRGVSVHRADCPNALDLKRHPERIIEVEWEGTPTAATYKDQARKVEMWGDVGCLDRASSADGTEGAARRGEVSPDAFDTSEDCLSESRYPAAPLPVAFNIVFKKG